MTVTVYGIKNGEYTHTDIECGEYDNVYMIAYKQYGYDTISYAKYHDEAEPLVKLY